MNRTWMPQTYGNPNVPPDPCQMVAAAEQFVALWMVALGDRAKLMRCDSRLILAAQCHTAFLAARTEEESKVSGHIGLNGSMPNARVREVGYRLPDHYEQDRNNVESFVRTHEGPSDALARLLKSGSHYVHLMGIEWFAGHTVYGVGHTLNDYIILICPPEP